MKKKVLCIIPTFNAEKHLGRCLASLRDSIAEAASEEYTTDIVVVDDGSKDRTQQIALDGGVKQFVSGDGNWWWSGSINRGVEIARQEAYDIVLLFNADNFVPRDYFRVMFISAAEKKETVIASCVYHENGHAFFLGATINGWGQFRYIAKAENKFTLSDVFGGMGVLIPVTVFDKVGLFDEKRLPLYFGDTDFWVRCKKQHIPMVIDRDLHVFVDAENTGAKARGNKLLFFAKNITNRKFHANIISVSRFYRNNFLILGLPLFVFLFYFNHMISFSKKTFKD